MHKAPEGPELRLLPGWEVERITKTNQYAVKSQTQNRGQGPARNIMCGISQKRLGQEFPGSPVVRTQSFYCHGLGSTPGQGTKIPQAGKPQDMAKNKRK